MNSILRVALGDVPRGIRLRHRLNLGFKVIRKSTRFRVARLRFWYAINATAMWPVSLHADAGTAKTHVKNNVAAMSRVVVFMMGAPGVCESRGRANTTPETRHDASVSQELRNELHDRLSQDGRKVCDVRCAVPNNHDALPLPPLDRSFCEFDLIASIEKSPRETLKPLRLGVDVDQQHTHCVANICGKGADTTNIRTAAQVEYTKPLVVSQRLNVAHDTLIAGVGSPNNQKLRMARREIGKHP